ncbi:MULTISPECIES: DUF3017 domain-containing protein [unclassified Streptomyces]|uniref:DUF3017 domain-containing protein n=1 Tax=unclassified Streptomyces TaxID=2593676 RepID=UPI003651C288
MRAEQDADGGPAVGSKPEPDGPGAVPDPDPDAPAGAGAGAGSGAGTDAAPAASAGAGPESAAGAVEPGPEGAGPEGADGPVSSDRARAGAAAARSRRFPAVTQDTARPEGGGRAIPGAVSTPARQWPMLGVLAATAVGLLLTATGRPRAGCLAIGIALIAAAVMRRALPSVGMLAVRSRFTDMVTYGLLGVAITLLAMVIEPDPWLQIPFLETAVRFTVR